MVTMDRVLNFNIGVLGHVDSGKTSLSKTLSTIASTASFDKNPQSQERGITIDLGFSSFLVDAPPHIKELNYSKIQYTLVDCPGHGSLIRTIIGGAQIIDAMMLVVDITKGIQTQTAECLVIGEILCNHMLIILNKLDMIPVEKQTKTIEKITKKLMGTLKNTKFANAKIITIAAKPGGQDDSQCTPIGIHELTEAMKLFTYVPEREIGGSFVFAVDHCFSIKGQGTVLTGTVLKGAVCVNDIIEMPTLKMSKKVKSMQMFRSPIDKASQGDRLGICVTQFDPKLLERGIVGSPSLISIAYGALAKVEKITYYKLPIETKAKFHVSMGHETVMAKVTFFGSEKNVSCESFIYNEEYTYQSELLDLKKVENLDENYKPVSQFAVLEFERPIPVLAQSVLIGSKLDMDVHTTMCRLAFKGHPLEIFTNKSFASSDLDKIKVYKKKSKEGIVERMVNDSEVIVKNLFNKDTNIQLFVGLRVELSTGECGIIDGTFGQSGKVKVRMNADLSDETKTKLQQLNTSKRKNKGQENKPVSHGHTEAIRIHLDFKKYMFSHEKKIIQS